MTWEVGDAVWFNRGSGPERGTVIFTDRAHVAIGIGDRSALDGQEGFIERIIRLLATVHREKSEVPA